MAERDLPETARPWTDKLGNVWCVKLEEDGISCRLCLLSDGRWRELGVPAYLPFFPVHLLAGLGRTLPPVPSRKRVARIVELPNRIEVAAKGSTLYWRRGDYGWTKLAETLSEPRFIAAAHEAFQHAGDVLPGEEASDA